MNRVLMGNPFMPPRGSARRGGSDPSRFASHSVRTVHLDSFVDLDSQARLPAFAGNT
jgi:hypothetical protein